jgi:CDP-2,3-bis-(O-geranylgeranyl)-sn-glycerol synthase
MLELKLLLLILLANGAPLLADKVFGNAMGLAVDFSQKSRSGKYWLGPTKTYRGILAAVAACGACAPMLGLPWKTGILIGLLAMVGDLCSSFIKRRLSIAPSSSVPGLDQIPESLFPMIYCQYLFGLYWISVAIVVVGFWICNILLSLLFTRFRLFNHPS